MQGNRIEGIGHQIKGTLKHQFGRLIGDAKLAADGAAEQALGAAQNVGPEPLIPLIDAERITGVGDQMKGASELGLGRLIGDAKLVDEGSAELRAGESENAAGSARDEAREAREAAAIGSAHEALKP